MSMRLHFISRLALLLAGGFLVVCSQVWTGGTLEWLFVVGGAVAIAIAAIDAFTDSSAQRFLDGLLALVGAWSIVEVLVLNNAHDVKWWSFAVACAFAGLSAIGLVVHETSTERVVHELTVTHSHEQREPAPSIATARS